jgi:hypothetical protein
MQGFARLGFLLRGGGSLRNRLLRRSFEQPEFRNSQVRAIKDAQASLAVKINHPLDGKFFPASVKQFGYRAASD